MRIIACLTILLVSFMNIGCQQNNEGTALAKTREAESYPWAFYPIDKESQTALCQALRLPDDDRICQPEKEVMFQRDILRKVEEVFPIGKTSYMEVEEKLGRFPHLMEENRNPEGTLISLTYVYRLTSYEGACISFFIDSKDGTFGFP